MSMAIDAKALGLHRMGVEGRLDRVQTKSDFPQDVFTHDRMGCKGRDGRPI